jgi:hypothetical protein
VEIDRDSDGRFSVIADGSRLGTASVPWTSTAVGAFAETHLPTEFLPGSAAEPELISGFQEEVGGTWFPYTGRALTTNSQFRVAMVGDHTIQIWDIRQTSS